MMTSWNWNILRITDLNSYNQHLLLNDALYKNV